ncbi:hypothetical protein Tsubulata_018394 [Turnera subulata]|uniref:RRM domain-containing protein n=1 Tax=Turnera subulata TaxID=218843 RepID=A0A9Q0G7S0_9ROSI|nr:hypothetical protein Tsubulata_018394 [Turnera subulata]
MSAFHRKILLISILAPCFCNLEDVLLMYPILYSISFARTSVFTAGISFSSTEKALAEAFSKFGEVVEGPGSKSLGGRWMDVSFTLGFDLSKLISKGTHSGARCYMLLCRDHHFSRHLFPSFFFSLMKCIVTRKDDSLDHNLNFGEFVLTFLLRN